MEISPIPAVRILSTVKIPSGEGQPLAVFDVDPSARPGDGGSEGQRRKAAGAEEDEFESLAAEGEPQSLSEAPEGSPAKAVDYFA